MATAQDSQHFDVIVVGGGAAGCVLAARLAESDLRILVLEAGGDPLASDEVKDSGRSTRDDYDVPAFHAFSSENPELSSPYWVRHHAGNVQQQRDWRYCPQHDGILYPRVRGLGGCTAHHAMIVVRPSDADWDHIAAVTGDASWRAGRMQKYWERIERCRTRFFLWRWLWWLTRLNPTGHGWRGWLTTEVATPLRGLLDRRLRRKIFRSIGAAGDLHPGLTADWNATNLDPNERRWWKPSTAGIRIPPLGTRRHVRRGPRERLRAVEARRSRNLVLQLEAQVVKVEFEGDTATAVRYRHEGQELRATAREIVLSGGTFATPQLLMLSGVGEPAHLAEHGIPLVAALPGVGRNLQDRYEVGVVNRMPSPWRALRGATYSRNDWHYRLWKWFRIGNYTSNGLAFAVQVRSQPGLPVPDLFCFALLADFRGYYPGYSERIRKQNYLTWAILKAYTDNATGLVRLRSADPDAKPSVLFNSFSPASPGAQADLDAVVTAVRFVRDIADAMGEDTVEEEPGRWRSSTDALRDYVRDNAWGHHACGSCAMKPASEGGVVDSRFRVHGLKGLRVVDASVFPLIPGCFLVSAVYMIAERAADTILEDLNNGSGRDARAG